MIDWDRKLNPFNGYHDPVTAIAGSAVIGAIGADKSRKAQSSAASENIAENRRQFDFVQQQTQQYRDVGGRALSALERMTMGDYDITKNTGYQFRLDEGYKGLDRSQAGRRLGGRAAKEAMRYGQGMASQEYGNEFNRLSQMANYGVGGTAQSIAGTNQATANITNSNTNAANATSQGYMDQNEILQGTAQNLTMWNMYNQGGRTGYGGTNVVGDAYMPANLRN